MREVSNKIKDCLNDLYRNDRILFRRNNGGGLCERCLVFRFAFYLQKKFNDYYVDCDFNSSNVNGQERHGKPIRENDGRLKKRFIDIIIHKRTFDDQNGFICFEIKKWNNTKYAGKDINNLKVLTREYGYKFGFFIILGKTKNETEMLIFQNGKEIEV